MPIPTWCLDCIRVTPPRSRWRMGCTPAVQIEPRVHMTVLVHMVTGNWELGTGMGNWNGELNWELNN